MGSVVIGYILNFGIQFLNFRIQKAELMAYNNHKRLTRYLSKPVHTSRSASMDYWHSTQFSHTDKLHPHTIPHHPYIQVQPSPTPILASTGPSCCKCCCHSRNVKTINTQNQYFCPQIKNIKNALLDIKQEMRYLQYPAYVQNMQNMQNRLNQDYHLGMGQQKGNVEGNAERELRINGMELRINGMEGIVEELQIKNKQIMQDKLELSRKITLLEQEIQQRKTKYHQLEAQKIQSGQRERQLQLKILDILSQSMKKQQQLRDLNWQLQQQHTTKRKAMSISDQMSMMISQGSRKEARTTQTYLTEVDIQGWFREINQVQDQLCDRINSNVRIQHRIFAHLEDLEQRLSDGYEKLHRVREQALRAGLAFTI